MSPYHKGTVRDLSLAGELFFVVVGMRGSSVVVAVIIGRDAVGSLGRFMVDTSTTPTVPHEGDNYPQQEGNRQCRSQDEPEASPSSTCGR